MQVMLTAAHTPSCLGTGLGCQARLRTKPHTSTTTGHVHLSVPALPQSREAAGQQSVGHSLGNSGPVHPGTLFQPALITTEAEPHSNT